jgi:hypothetical protein
MDPQGPGKELSKNKEQGPEIGHGREREEGQEDTILKGIGVR